MSFGFHFYRIGPRNKILKSELLSLVTFYQVAFQNVGWIVISMRRILNSLLYAIIFSSLLFFL